jgi:hypothetical protein
MPVGFCTCTCRLQPTSLARRSCRSLLRSPLPSRHSASPPRQHRWRAAQLLRALGWSRAHRSSLARARAAHVSSSCACSQLCACCCAAAFAASLAHLLRSLSGCSGCRTRARAACSASPAWLAAPRLRAGPALRLSRYLRSRLDTRAPSLQPRRASRISALQRCCLAALASAVWSQPIRPAADAAPL